jgi:hypothetical protein
MGDNRERDTVIKKKALTSRNGLARASTESKTSLSLAAGEATTRHAKQSETQQGEAGRLGNGRGGPLEHDVS